jgi:membrane protein
VQPVRPGSSSIEVVNHGEGSIPAKELPWHGRSIHFVGALWREIEDDHVLDGAAVLAFFFMLAVFPAGIFVLSLLTFVSIPHLHQALADLLRQILPEQSAKLFHGAVRYVTSEGKKGLLTFGLIFALWSGSSGVYAIMEQLNVVGDIKDRRPFWKARGMAILLMLFFAVLVIGSLWLVILGGVVQSWVASLIGWSRPLRWFFATLRWIILGGALLLALAVAYRFGPDAQRSFRYLAPGNLSAAILIALASAGFRFYVAEFGHYSATYGSLAAIIILMLWMYFAGIALLVGGEINTLLGRNLTGESEGK